MSNVAKFNEQMAVEFVSATANKLYNEDCIEGALQHLPDKCVDLAIHDPPFGINETKFGQCYNRKKENVLDGYVEAPCNYEEWTYRWLAQAKRVLKDNGSMYVVSGRNHLFDVLNAIHRLNLHEINHLIWKYNFGVFTRRKFVTSHYHILHLAKSPEAKVTFNTFCRYTLDDTDSEGNRLIEADLSSVWFINREYHRGRKKNCNKLPAELVRKMLLYSSNPGDTVCDFFLGNFTTAVGARKLGRQICGFELNPVAFTHGMEAMHEVSEGSELKDKQGGAGNGRRG